MPRFFFDIVDGALTTDDTGTEFETAQQARDQIIKTLPNIAQDTIGEGSSRQVLVLMRDENGRTVFTASLSLTAQWLIDVA